VSSLRPGLTHKLKGKLKGNAIRWRESLELKGATQLAQFENGDAAFISAANHHYLACWPDQAALDTAVGYVVKQARLSITKLPEGVRLRRRGDVLFVLNYGNKPYRITQKGKVLLGRRDVGPQDLTILKCE
jgi:beta-galactosidase